MQTAAETHAADLSQWVHQTERAAHSLAYAAPVQDGDSGANSVHFRREIENGNLPTDVTAVHYLDGNGTDEASSTTDAVGSSAGDRDVPWTGELAVLGADEVQSITSG